MTRGEILLALDNYLDRKTQDYYYYDWEEELREWLVTRPQRSDLATPFLLYHVLHNKEDVSSEVINVIRKNNPEDPIGLWFKGLSLLESESLAGISMMKKAIKNGIERFITIDADTLEALRAN